MKISEVIEKLGSIREKWGNLEVCCPSKLVNMTNRVHDHNLWIVKNENVCNSTIPEPVNVELALSIESNEIYEDDCVFEDGSCISGLIELLRKYQERIGDKEVVTTSFEGPTRENGWTLYSFLNPDNFNVLKKENDEVICVDGSMMGEKVNTFWPSEHPENMKMVLYIGGKA